MVPVIRGADHMNFAQIEKTINTLGKKANDGSISIDDMAGGTFTISNGGVYGSLISTPIINPPQVGCCQNPNTSSLIVSLHTPESVLTNVRVHCIADTLHVINIHVALMVTELPVKFSFLFRLLFGFSCVCSMLSFPLKFCFSF